MALCVEWRLLLLLAVLSTARTQFTLFKVDASTGGVCLDGSPGAFYYRPGTAATKWMFHFQGGGWCVNPRDCYMRSLSTLGSSKDYPSTMTHLGSGMLDLSCAVNPQFCDWNIVYLMYCDGNSFSGNRSSPLLYEGYALYMQGHNILQAVFAQVLANEGINASTPYSQATDVVLSGCSAGGLATFLHTDFVHATYVPPTAQFWSIPISGFFLDASNVVGQRVYAERMKGVWDMQQPCATCVNAACVSGFPASEAWKCNMAEYTYRHITARIFPLNSGYDRYQLDCILTSEPVLPGNKTNPAGVCGSAPGWSSCNSDPNTCTDGEMPLVNAFYAQFKDKMNGTATASRPQNGGFISSCHTHCEAVQAGWSTFRVGGMLMRDAVSAWMNSTSTGPVFYWDCDYNATGTPRYCNPTCSSEAA